jgi:hypothetical protein
MKIEFIKNRESSGHMNPLEKVFREYKNTRRKRRKK